MICHRVVSWISLAPGPLSNDSLWESSALVAATLAHAPPPRSLSRNCSFLLLALYLVQMFIANPPYTQKTPTHCRRAIRWRYITTETRRLGCGTVRVAIRRNEKKGRDSKEGFGRRRRGRGRGYWKWARCAFYRVHSYIRHGGGTGLRAFVSTLIYGCVLL